MNTDYKEYISTHLLTKNEIIKRIESCNTFNYNPLISIIVPVYNVDPKWLERCIMSVLNQYYSNWELCLYDDNSTNSETLKCLEKWKEKDCRIKVKFGTTNNNISIASNNAIKFSSGEFIALLDNDDEISPDALFEVVSVLNYNPSVDFFYSDEDKIEKDGSFSFPYFKPGFNKYLFQSTNYLCHFSVIRRTIGDSIGWFRKGYEGSQDYDLFLRISLITDKIYHIPKILYHWRRIIGSTAHRFNEKSYAQDAGKRALQDFFKKQNKSFIVQNTQRVGIYKIKPETLIKNTILVAIYLDTTTKNNFSNIEKTILKMNSDIFKVVVFGSEANLRKFNELKLNVQKIIVDNYKDYINSIRQIDKAEFILLLNSKVNIEKIEAINEMLIYFENQDVGAVGGKILNYNKIYHSGIAKGKESSSTYLYQGLDKNFPGYFSGAEIVQCISACSIEFIMIRKHLVDVLNIASNTMDILDISVYICDNIYESGFKVLYNPFSEVYIFDNNIVKRTLNLEDRFQSPCLHIVDNKLKIIK